MNENAALAELYWRWNTELFEGNPRRKTVLTTTNATWTGRGLNPGLRGVRVATNGL